VTVHTNALDLGFDLIATRDALLNWLIQKDAVPLADIPPVPDASLPESERNVALWARTRDAAMIHICLHGVPVEERDSEERWAEQRRCNEPACAIAAVSFALEELCSYWAEFVPREIALKIGIVASVLDRLDPAILQDLDSSASAALPGVERQLRQMQESATATAAQLTELGDHAAADEVLGYLESAGNPVLQWKGLLELCRKLAKVTAGSRFLSREIDKAVRARGMLRHLQRTAGAGRPRQTLLDALLQHLKLGGFSYREMTQLVVGMADGVTSTSLQARKDQIRHRIRGEDLRTIRPLDE
jgi:hypothetical protein